MTSSSSFVQGNPGKPLVSFFLLLPGCWFWDVHGEIPKHMYAFVESITRKTMHNRDVVFKEVESTSKNEDESNEKGPKKIEFEIKDEGYGSNEEEE